MLRWIAIVILGMNLLWLAACTSTPPAPSKPALSPAQVQKLQQMRLPSKLPVPVDDIKATVEPIIGGYGHKNLYYDIVRTGRKLWISVYITFDKDIISLSKFQILQTKCIAALAEKYQDFYFELLPDIQLDSIDEEKIKAHTEEED